MEKNLGDMDFNEMVKVGVEMEIDAYVSGKSLKTRVFDLVELGARWRYEKSEKNREEDARDANS